MSDLDAFFADLDITAGSDVRLDVDADLQMQVTTPKGASTSARVTGRGQQILVEAGRPDLLLAAVDRADIGRVADLLAVTGITVTVLGPDGPVARLGAGTSSRVGQAFTGSAAVAPGGRAAVRLVWGRQTVRVIAVAMPIMLMAIAVVRRLRRTG